MQDTLKYYKYLPVFELTKKERKLLEMCSGLKAVAYLCPRVSGVMREMSFIQRIIYNGAAHRLRLKIQEAIDAHYTLAFYIVEFLPYQEARWFELEYTSAVFSANLRTLWIQKLLEHNPK